MVQALEGNLFALLPALLRPRLPVGRGLVQEESADSFTERSRAPTPAMSGLPKSQETCGPVLGGSPCSHDAIQQAWHDYHGPIHTDEGDGFVPSMPPTFMRGFVDGFQYAEKLIRQALRGHSDSELWGEHGLIAATMQCVDAVQSDSANVCDHRHQPKASVTTKENL
jgi:hypothetical protein